jgi:hypothetical protein
MDELRDKLPPTFSSAATGHLFTSTVRTTMAGDGRETTMHKVTAPEKGMPLIEEGFPDFAFVARHHLTGTTEGTAGEHPALQQSAGLHGL